MEAKRAARLLAAHLEQPLEVWPEFDPRRVPFAIYDEREVRYLNHPSPPDEPPELHAATDMKIGGALTAVVPAAYAKDEAELVPLAYHEAFHVYQSSGGFAPGPSFDFFTALAHYPELDDEYLALCLLEAALFNDSGIELEQKAAALAQAARERHAILARKEDALRLETFSERTEGTASYVEHRVAHGAFGRPYPPVSGGSKRVRVYSAGAALGRLLDALGANWQRRVEKGATLSGVLMDAFPDDVDLRPYGLARMHEQTRAKVKELRNAVETELSRAFSTGTVALTLPPGTPIYRSFNPQRITSLGDGRLVYRGLRLDLPSGYVQLSEDMPALEDVRARTLHFPARQVRLEGDRLLADEPDVRIHIEQVTQEDEGSYRLTGN
ncbi:hypothetical protein [Oceanithermus sp.]|uniref:hypothetical protein n=1 Tax=Oceanithermus sp. TaxID=2268145 RepID=UPI0025EF6AD5|nr:hypothetical protein [Oceanithermus sp.]